VKQKKTNNKIIETLIHDEEKRKNKHDLTSEICLERRYWQATGKGLGGKSVWVGRKSEENVNSGGSQSLHFQESHVQEA
jgi:hypothetical protein